MYDRDCSSGSVHTLRHSERHLLGVSPPTSTVTGARYGYRGVIHYHHHHGPNKPKRPFATAQMSLIVTRRPRPPRYCTVPFFHQVCNGTHTPCPRCSPFFLVIPQCVAGYRYEVLPTTCLCGVGTSKRSKRLAGFSSAQWGGGGRWQRKLQKGTAQIQAPPPL